MIPFLLLCAVLTLVGCATVAVQENAPAATLRGKQTLVLDPTLFPPLEQGLLEETLADFERGLALLPHLGKTVTRAAFQAATSNDGAIRNTYELYSNTLSVAGFSERGTANALRSFEQVELLVMAQLFYVPCQHCDEFHTLALIGNLIEAETGKIAWRAHLVERYLDDTPENRRKLAKKMVPQLLALLEEMVSPKWQRHRFTNLAKRRGAG